MAYALAVSAMASPPGVTGGVRPYYSYESRRRRTMDADGDRRRTRPYSYYHYLVVHTTTRPNYYH